MKLRAACVLLFVLSSVAICLAQNPSLDIVFEGPWMFYPENNFNGKSVLVAIAPNVPGHNLMSFSTGDGGPVPFGTYCLVFDSDTACKVNATTILTSSTKPNPVMLSKPNAFNWTKVTNAYVIILPMPDSYSSDAMHAVTFQDSFPKPSPSPTPVSTAQDYYSIGLILHYKDSPQQVKLNSCSAPPSPANCNQDANVNQPNLAPLHISIKSSDAPDPCDYHVHRAYHKMINLLESMGGMTTKTLRFVDVPVYREVCSLCDPQQDMVPSDCTVIYMSMAEADKTDEIAAFKKVTEELGRLIKLLGTAPTEQQGCIRLPQLKMQRDQWGNASFPFITLSELQSLQFNLIQSENGIRTLLSGQACSLENNAFKKADIHLSPENLRILNTARAQEQALRTSILPVYAIVYDSVSGKNCRVTEMLVQ